MRFDLHCHTKNGSLDGQIDIEEYVSLLRKKGYQGMLVTDHNSYKGYRAWKKIKQRTHEYDDFVVIKGIEYDTLDAGHILVVMPDDVHLKILEIRGLPVAMLIKVVHAHGGILGPAHPYGARFLSAMFSKRIHLSPKLVDEFDFFEAFNTCETPESNRNARALRDAYGKPGFGGSDSHRTRYVGTAFTDIDWEITCADDFIAAVKANAITQFGGVERPVKKKAPAFIPALIEFSWKCYNQGLARLKRHKRKLQFEESLQNVVMYQENEKHSST